MSVVLSLFFAAASQTFDLPKGLLSSICWVESSHRVNVVHKDDGNGNSVGVCQIKLSTAQWLGFEGTEKELMKPETNTYYAAKYLRYQLDRYGNLEKALVAYNQGSARDLLRTRYSDKVLAVWRSHGKARKT